MKELQIENISGVDCYEKDGTAYLKLESVAKGLGFTEVKNGKDYVTVQETSDGMSCHYIN